MKLMYLLATFAVVLVMMASCTRQSVTGYTLTAAIDGIPDGSHVQLFPVSHGHEKPVADTTVVDGKFIFKGVADEPLAVRLMVKPKESCPAILKTNTWAASPFFALPLIWRNKRLDSVIELSLPSAIT